jgi:hypothetical protein
VRELDDHADIIAVELVTDTTQYGGKSANLVRALSRCIGETQNTVACLLCSYMRVLWCTAPKKLTCFHCCIPLQRRKMCVSRFWQLDDDGVYLVTYSSVKDDAVTPSLTVRPVCFVTLYIRCIVLLGFCNMNGDCESRKIAHRVCVGVALMPGKQLHCDHTYRAKRLC